MVHMDKLGRKFFVVFSMVLSGGCVFFIYLVTSKAANLALSCAFGFVSVMGFNALDCLGIELFPTHLRYHYRCSHGLRTPRDNFFQKSEILDLKQTFWAEIFEAFGVFSVHFGTVCSLSMFSIIQPLFLQKTKPLYPHPKYLFGIGIWIWAAKNLGFSHRVSVVLDIFAYM